MDVTQKLILDNQALIMDGIAALLHKDAPRSGITGAPWETPLWDKLWSSATNTRRHINSLNVKPHLKSSR